MATKRMDQNDRAHKEKQLVVLETQHKGVLYETGRFLDDRYRCLFDYLDSRVRHGHIRIDIGGRRAGTWCSGPL